MNEEEQSQLLARLDERTSQIKSDLSQIKAELSGKYVTLDQFEPIKRIVYGMVGIILITFIAALAALVVN